MPEETYPDTPFLRFSTPTLVSGGSGGESQKEQHLCGEIEGGERKTVNEEDEE